MEQGHQDPEVLRGQIKPTCHSQQAAPSKDIGQLDPEAGRDSVLQGSPPQCDISSPASGSPTQRRAHRKVTEFLRSYKPSSNSVKRLTKVTQKIALAHDNDSLFRDPVQ
jgi:hypothetical protein